MVLTTQHTRFGDRLAHVKESRARGTGVKEPGRWTWGACVAGPRLRLTLPGIYNGSGDVTSRNGPGAPTAGARFSPRLQQGRWCVSQTPWAARPGPWKLKSAPAWQKAKPSQGRAGSAPDIAAMGGNLPRVSALCTQGPSPQQRLPQLHPPSRGAGLHLDPRDRVQVCPKPQSLSCSGEPVFMKEYVLGLSNFCYNHASCQKKKSCVKWLIEFMAYNGVEN